MLLSLFTKSISWKQLLYFFVFSMVICLLTVVTIAYCIGGQVQSTPRGVHAQTNDDNSSISVLDFLG